MISLNINVSIQPEDYSEKVKRFDNLAVPSDAIEYVQEEIQISMALDKSGDFLAGTFKKHDGTPSEDSQMARSEFVESSELAVSRYE